jgi:hypothetical protein
VLKPPSLNSHSVSNRLHEPPVPSNNKDNLFVQLVPVEFLRSNHNAQQQVNAEANKLFKIFFTSVWKGWKDWSEWEDLVAVELLVVVNVVGFMKKRRRRKRTKESSCKVKSIVALLVKEVSVGEEALVREVIMKKVEGAWEDGVG